MYMYTHKYTYAFIFIHICVHTMPIHTHTHNGILIIKKSEITPFVAIYYVFKVKRIFISKISNLLF